MKIELIRDNVINNSQFGKLYIDNVYQCETLENASTLIPCSTFKLGLRTSGGWYEKEKNKKRYKSFRGIIEIQGVPDRKYILFHPANKPSELKGCIAPGKSRSNDNIFSSRLAYYPLYTQICDLLSVGKNVSIEIREKFKKEKGENKMVLGKLFGGGALKSISNVVDDMQFSDEEKEKLKLQFEEIESKLKSKQMDINLADAKSTAGGLSGFMQRSWRPLIGMSCALAIFWEFVLSKIILFICGLFHYRVINLPELDMGTLMPLVMSLLGMGALRTYEKTKGVTK